MTKYMATENELFQLLVELGASGVEAGVGEAVYTTQMVNPFVRAGHLITKETWQGYMRIYFGHLFPEEKYLVEISVLADPEQLWVKTIVAIRVSIQESEKV